MIVLKQVAAVTVVTSVKIVKEVTVVTLVKVVTVDTYKKKIYYINKVCMYGTGVLHVCVQ